MHYFKLPRLGAYLAVPLVYESYLKERIFEDALEQKLNSKEIWKSSIKLKKNS